MKTLAERLIWARLEKQLSQQQVADGAGVAQSTIGSLESGARRTARKIASIAAYLEVDPLWLAEGKGEPRQAARVGNVSAYDVDDGVPDDMVLVKESRVEFSAGPGKQACYELVEDSIPASYRRDWFQKEGMNPDKVVRFRVAGRSMEPFLYANDTILVNTGETNIVDGKLYAIRYGDELRVKYLSRRLDGTLILRSVNPDYKDEEVPSALAEEHISVIGRVRDKSGRGGL